MQGAGFEFVLGVTDDGQVLSEVESHMTTFPASRVSLGTSNSLELLSHRTGDRRDFAKRRNF